MLIVFPFIFAADMKITLGCNFKALLTMSVILLF